MIKSVQNTGSGINKKTYCIRKYPTQQTSIKMRFLIKFVNIKQFLVQQMATQNLFTIAVQLYYGVTSVNSVCMSDKIINNCNHFRINCLFYSKKVQFYVFIIFCFYTFLFNHGKHVKCEKILFSLLYLTLVTSCIIGPFLCCHLLYLIIYLTEIKNKFVFFLLYSLKTCKCLQW